MINDKMKVTSAAERRILSPLVGRPQAIVPPSPLINIKTAVKAAEETNNSNPPAPASAKSIIRPGILKIAPPAPVAVVTPEPQPEVPPETSEAVAELPTETVVELANPVVAGEPATPPPAEKTAATKDSTKSRRRSSSKAESNEAVTDEEPILLELPRSKVDVVAAISQMFPPMEDAKWTEFEAEIRSEMRKIRDMINPDMTPGSVRIVTQDLNHLLMKTALSFSETKTVVENLASTAKIPGAIERVIMLGSSGNNEIERKRNGILAAANYNGSINMFEVYGEMRRRFDFLNAVMDFIRQSNGHIISVNASLKLDCSTTLQ